MSATAAPLVVEADIVVRVDPGRAFEAWTAGINNWWRLDSPFWMDKERRRGLRFEPRVGGRFIEVYDDDGGGFEIGRVTDWEPGRVLGYTWRQSDWPEDAVTRVEITFAPVAEGTRVSVRHSGFEKLRDAGIEISTGYNEGLRMLLGWYQEALS